LAVAIGGAGIGGLSAAAALANKGIDAVVFEQATEPRALGAGLHLWSNAVRALREMDPGGLPSAPPAGRSAPRHSPSRSRVLEGLLEAVSRDALRLDRRLTGFHEDEQGVELQIRERCE
jgi:glycine/D-amino acid oxidase-like deaminating enzyme